MNTSREAPLMREMVESYVRYRKASGMKPLDRSHKVYQLLFHSEQDHGGKLTPGLLEKWWEKRQSEQPQTHIARVLGVVPLLRHASGQA